MMKPEQKAVLEKFSSQHDGKPLDQKAMLKPNPMIQKVLTARLLSMSPQQQEAVKKILTPETAESLKILLPEISGLIDRGMNLIKRGMRNG